MNSFRPRLHSWMNLPARLYIRAKLTDKSGRAESLTAHHYHTLAGLGRMTASRKIVLTIHAVSPTPVAEDRRGGARRTSAASG